MEKETKKILVFGTGSVAEYLIHLLDKDCVEIIAFIDDFEEGNFYEYPIISRKEIGTYEYDYIFIASGYEQKIRKLLISDGVNAAQICSFIFDEESFFYSLEKQMHSSLEQITNQSIIINALKKEMTFPQFHPAIFWDMSHSIKKVYKDFVREQTLKLIADQIHETGIFGAVAELGVYKGDFTIIIDEFFSHEKLYLFDTFDGFDASDLEQDFSINNKKIELKKFKDSNEEIVLNRLNNKNRVVLKKGLFPNTFDIYDEEFSFVSIDLNLYQPVYDALDLFYPRLKCGGVIMISDYYAPFYKGTHEAVKEWCAINKKSPIPIADFYGSVLVIKE